jgi:hypothetical protein
MSPKGGVHLVFFYACRRITALTEILLLGAIAHHTGVRDDGLFFGIFRDSGFVGHIGCSGADALLSTHRAGFGSGANQTIPKPQRARPVSLGEHSPQSVQGGCMMR